MESLGDGALFGFLLTSSSASSSSVFTTWSVALIDFRYKACMHSPVRCHSITFNVGLQVRGRLDEGSPGVQGVHRIRRRKSGTFSSTPMPIHPSIHPSTHPPIHPSTHPSLTIARVSPRSPAARWAALESVTNFLRKPDIRCTGPCICNPCVLMHLCNIVATWG